MIKKPFRMVIVRKINENTLKMIESIRRNPGCTKSELANMVNMPWSSAYTILTRIEKNLVLIPDNSDDNKDKQATSNYRAGITLNNNCEYYVGVSVGSSQLKVVIIGFGFNIVTLDSIDDDNFKSQFNNFFMVMKKNSFQQEKDGLCEWCQPTPKDIISLSKVLVAFGKVVCDMKKNGVPIAAINYTLPGHIDYYNQTIISTSHLCNNSDSIKNTNITRLITSNLFNQLIDNDVSVYIDHNVKSSAIAEKERMVSKGHRGDLIVVYLGHGVGMSSIINGKVYRDRENFAGQLGDVEIIYNKKTQKFEDVLRNDIFGQTKIDFSAKELTHFLMKNDDKRQQLSKIVAQVLKNLFFIFGIKDIVFSGKFDEILFLIEFELTQALEDLGVFGVNLHHSFYDQYSAAVGAAMNCFYNNINIEYQTSYE